MNGYNWARMRAIQVEEELEKLLYDELPEFEVPQIKRCEWCHQPLPNERYHLKICPRCRKASIEAFIKG